MYGLGTQQVCSVASMVFTPAEKARHSLKARFLESPVTSDRHDHVCELQMCANTQQDSRRRGGEQGPSRPHWLPSCLWCATCRAVAFFGGPPISKALLWPLEQWQPKFPDIAQTSESRVADSAQVLHAIKILLQCTIEGLLHTVMHQQQGMTAPDINCWLDLPLEFGT